SIAHGQEHLCKVERPMPKKKRSKKVAEEESKDWGARIFLGELKYDRPESSKPPREPSRLLATGLQ
ncbi:MAG: hypothetical protein NTZ94_14620, partial [Verrucomicrobia bacterium]|nr:hypothetical protein [Verrucomicrobiota bacterium]